MWVEGDGEGAEVEGGAADRGGEAENRVYERGGQVELGGGGGERASGVIEPGGLRSAPLVPWEPEGETPAPGRYAIATYTLDCGHQAVELLRQDPDAAPLWVEDGSVDHLVARDARSLTRLLYSAANIEEAQTLIDAAQANLARHPDEDDEARSDE